MNIKSNIIGVIYLVQQCCESCGKVAQSYEQNVYGSSTLSPRFSNNNIPVGWYSTHNGVYCSRECFKKKKVV